MRFLTLLLLTACAHDPVLQRGTAAAAGAHEPCTGREPSCKDLVASLAIDPQSSRSAPVKERRQHAHSIYGRCEILVDGSGTYPCTEVRVSLKKATGEERTSWLQGFEFEIPELTSGNYNLYAFSDQFSTGSELTKIKPGQAVRIQLKLSTPPSGTPAQTK